MGEKTTYLYEIIPTRVFRSGGTVLTYSSLHPLKPGQIVTIPLGKSWCVGIVTRAVKQRPRFPVRPILQIVYDFCLPAYLVAALFWLSDYYLAPLPEVAALALPNGVTTKRRGSRLQGKSIIIPADAKNSNSKNNTNTASQNDGSTQKAATRAAKTGKNTALCATKANENAKIPLNPAQKIALEGLESHAKGTLLLHGLTGSGKTNIYLKMALDAFQGHKSSIVLVPEIALAPQLVQVFQNLFGKNHVLLAHSQLTPAERHLLWEEALARTAQGEPLVVIGPRSALFTPLANLGLIIVDEAHEPAYYQENNPRYSAVRLAGFMTQKLKIRCVLGTATPLVVDYRLAQQKQALIPLTQKAKSTQPAKIQVVKLGSPTDFSQNRYFSNALLAAIKTNLKHHHQTLIFHNRRGSAPITVCDHCGWQALCPHCFLPLTLHADQFELHCHTCGYHQPVPLSCPNCGHADVIHKGFGTKLLESELRRLFPEARIARFDSDNVPSESLPALFAEVKAGDYEILIGTQTLARGLDLPRLATVGVVQADAGLALPDFAAEERAFHLLTQVIGRVGRGHLDAASAIIQTYQPDHPVIQFAIRDDYTGFADYLLKLRHQQQFPPYYYLADISVTYKTERTTIAKINTIHAALQQLLTQAAESEHFRFALSAPLPAFHERTQRGYTWRLLAKSSARTPLKTALGQLDPKLGARIVIDPPSLL